jgi:hypothetical protein
MLVRERSSLGLDWSSPPTPAPLERGDPLPAGRGSARPAEAAGARMDEMGMRAGVRFEKKTTLR